MVRIKSYKQKQLKNSEYVRRFRNALHYELQKDYDEAMVAWALAEIASPTKEERERAKARKQECLRKSNQQLDRLLDDSTKTLLKDSITIG